MLLELTEEERLALLDAVNVELVDSYSDSYAALLRAVRAKLAAPTTPTPPASSPASSEPKP